MTRAEFILEATGLIKCEPARANAIADSCFEHAKTTPDSPLYYLDEAMCALRMGWDGTAWESAWDFLLTQAVARMSPPELAARQSVLGRLRAALSERQR